MKQSILSKRLAALCLAAGLAPLALAADAGDFFRAIKQDNDRAMRSLLAEGLDPNLRDDRGAPGLYVALQDGALKVASVLIDSPRTRARS